MPAIIGTMTGPSSAQSKDGTFDATLTVNATTGNVSYAADDQFPVDHELGLVQLRLAGRLHGARIGGTGFDNDISGNFYGTDGSVAAGNYPHFLVEIVTLSVPISCRLTD